LEKEYGSFKLVSEYGAQRAYFKVWVPQARKGSNPNTILFYSNAFNLLLK